MRRTLLAITALLPFINANADTEPNNNWQTALALPQDRTIAGVQSDDDWYMINAAVGTRILIDLTFTDVDGNIDLAIFDDVKVVSDPTGAAPGTLRDLSVGNTDHEFLDNNIAVLGPGTYYIQVYGQDAGNSYTLTWSELATVADDGFEENDSNAAVKPITESVVAFGAQANEDWYSIEVSSGSTRVLASLRFYNTQVDKTIDLNLELREPDGTLIDSSANATGINESINTLVPAAGTYHLRILGDDNGEGYALSWAGVSPTSLAVFPEPAVNQAPTAVANTVTTAQNTPYNFAVADFTFSDSEGDALVSATLANLSLGGGSLTHSAGTAVSEGDTLSATQLATLVYTPVVDASATPLASFDFTVNDFNAGTVAAAMAIDVTVDEPIDTTVPVATSSSSGALTPAWLLLLLAGLFRRLNR